MFLIVVGSVVSARDGDGQANTTTAAAEETLPKRLVMAGVLSFREVPIWRGSFRCLFLSRKFSLPAVGVLASLRQPQQTSGENSHSEQRSSKLRLICTKGRGGGEGLAPRAERV